MIQCQFYCYTGCRELYIWSHGTFCCYLHVLEYFGFTTCTCCYPTWRCNVFGIATFLQCSGMIQGRYVIAPLLWLFYFEWAKFLVPKTRWLVYEDMQILHFENEVTLSKSMFWFQLQLLLLKLITLRIQN